MTYREVRDNEYFAIYFSGHLFLDLPKYVTIMDIGNVRDYLEENEILENTWINCMDRKNGDFAILAPGVSPLASTGMVLVSDSLESIVEKVKPHIVRFNESKERKTSVNAVASVTKSSFPVSVKK